MGKILVGEFPFAAIPVPGGKIKRPLLEVSITNSHNPEVTLFSVVCLLDTGATHCLLSHQMCELLGHDLKMGKPTINIGVLGGGSFRAHRHSNRINVGGYEVDCDFYICADPERKFDFAILGQNGFFSQFDVCFNYSEDRFVLYKNR